MTQDEVLPTVEQEKAALREEFGPLGWSIVHTTDTRRWWGCRGPLTREELNEQASVDADSATALAAKIRAVLMESP